MKLVVKKVWPALLVGVLILGLSDLARAAADPAPPADPAPAAAPPTPYNARLGRKVWSAAELGVQGSIIAEGTTFLGPVLTVQGGHYKPIVGVFQLGAGIALYKEPIPDLVFTPENPAEDTKNNAMFYVGLGLRVRVFEFLASLRGKMFDLYVGPMAMLFGNKDLVTFGAAGELGFAVHIRRVRISLSVHGGYQTVLHQYAPADSHKFEASYVVGGQLSAGAQF